jgi:ParB-like chromosome segregation protein Spo0J
MITPYEFHELCCIFPRCSDEELQLLVADIRENGLLTPVTRYKGKILDGRNRYLACQMLNIEPDYVEFDGDNPLAFVISRNLCRRHLSESQRAMVAAAIIELQRQDDGRSKVTVAEVAEQLNVSDRLVYHAAKVIHEGTEQDVKDIMSGEKKVRAVSVELSKASEFTLSAVDPMVEQAQEFESRILSTARSMRRDMDEMFRLTKWSNEYKRVHRELRVIIFDE